MARKRGKDTLYRELVADYYNNYMQQKQNEVQAQANEQLKPIQTDLTREEVAKIYNDHIASMTNSQPSNTNTPTIPKLENIPTGQNNSAPKQNTPSTSISLPNLDDLRSQLADTTTNRTEGETKALQDYIQGVETLQQNTYKNNYNEEINNVRNRLESTDEKLTEGERKANEEYLSGLQTLQAEIDRYNRPKYTPNNASNNTTTNNAKQKKSKYEGKNIHIAESEKDKQLNENDIVEINGQYYTKQALADQRQANRERVRENKLMKSESDTVKGFVKKFESAKQQNLKNQVDMAYQMGKEEPKTTDAKKWMDTRYANSFQVGNIRNQQDKATQKAFEDGNNDALMQVFASLDNHSKQVIQQDYDEQKASKDGKAFNRDIYLNKLMEDNPGMTEETATKFLDNAKNFVDNTDNIDRYMRNSIDRFLDPNYVISPQEEAMFKTYMNDIVPNIMSDVEERYNDMQDTINPLKRLFSGTPEEKEYTSSVDDLKYYQRLKEVEDKLSKPNAIMQGLAQATPFSNQLTNLALMNDTEEQKNAVLNSGAFQSATQNPYSALAGNMAMQIGKYAAGGELIQNIPFLAKAGDKVGSLIKGESALANGVRNHLGNIVNDTMLDVAVDTIPSLAQDIADGKNVGDIALNTLENIGTNVGFNLFSDLLLSKGGYNNNSLVRDTLDDMDNARIDKVAFNNPNVEQATEKAMLDLGIVKDDAIKNATNTTNNVVDTLAKQEDEIRNIGNQVQDTIDNIPKVEPEIPKTYKDVKIQNKELDDNINTIANMYGKGFPQEDVIALKQALSQYAETGEEAFLNQAKQIANVLDGNYSPVSYMTKKGSDIPYLRNPKGTLAFNVDNYANSLRNIALSKQTTIDGLDNISKQIDDMVEKFGATDEMLSTTNSLKEAYNNLIQNPSQETFKEFNNAMNDVYNAFNGKIAYKSSYKGKVNGDTFSFKDVENIVDEAENIFKNPIRADEIKNAMGDITKTDTPNMADNLLDAKYSSKDIDTSAIPIDKTKTRIADNSYNGMRNMTIAKTEIQDDIKDAFLDVPRYHEVLSNKDTFARAEYILNNSKDTNEALQYFNGLVAKQDPVAIPLGYEIADRLAKSGNSEMAVDIIDKMSESLTKSGQFSQAAAITMMKNDPVTALRFIERNINKMNTEGLEKFGGRWKDFSLTDAEKDSILKLNRGDAEGIKKAYENIYDRISKEYPSTMWEKVVEATKLAMMLNPRTHIRNVGANLMLVPIRSLSDRVSALGQNAYHLFRKDFEVTQSLIGGTKAQRNIAEEIFENRMKPLLNDSDKWADMTSALRNKQVFKDSKIGELAKDGTLKTLGLFDSMTGGRMTHFIEGLDESMKGSVIENLRNFDYYLLSTVEDDPFVKKNFVNRLSSYMKAQGINDMADVSDKAIDIAWEESLKATFKDDNFMTKMFGNIKRDTGKFGEFMLPFTKTPANIAMRGIDYSPVGFATSVSNYLKSNKTQADVTKLFDNLSKAFVGTSGIYAGYLLAKNGIITGTLPDDKDAKKFAQQTGKLPFAINVGGRYYSYDWAQPAAIPMILGTALFESTNADEKEQKSFFGTLLDGSLNSVNAWADLSPLQSLQNLFKADPSTGKVDFARNLLDTAMDFPQRLIPSLGGAIARTIDPTQRETFVKGDSTSTWLNTAQSKIPGLTDELPAQRDGWGRPVERQSNDGFFNSSFLANFLNPGQLSNDRSTEIDPEIQRLFDATQENKVFPTIASYTVIDGNKNKIILDNYQHSELQKEMGETSFELAKGFINSEVYQNLPNEIKADYLSKMYGLAERFAKNKLFGTKIESDGELINMLRNGDYQSVVDSYVNSAYKKSVKEEMESQGLPFSDYTYELYTNNSPELEKIKTYQEMANNYTYTTKEGDIETIDINKTIAEKLDKLPSSERSQYLEYVTEAKDKGYSVSEKGYEQFKSGKLDSYETEYKELLKEYNTNDSKELYELWEKQGSKGFEEHFNQGDSLKKYGLDTTAALKTWEKLSNQIPTLTMQDFSAQYRKIDADHNGSLKKQEFIDYLNSNNNITESEGKKLYKDYGNSSWKEIKYVENPKKGQKHWGS